MVFLLIRYVFSSFHSLPSLITERAANPITTVRPMDDRSVEYSMSATDNVPPNTAGSADSMKSQLPQHPSGTREKNERNELMAVLPPETPVRPLPMIKI